MTNLLKCPECNESSRLSTIERVDGLALCKVHEDGEVVYEGNTEILYDTSEIIGIVCRCGWIYEGDDWINKLGKEQ